MVARLALPVTLIAAIALILALVVLSRSAGDLSGEPVAVAVKTYPIRSFEIGDRERTRFGALEWRGGLEVEADSPHFGGLSGIALLDAEGEFAMVSDTGIWVRSRFHEDANGRLTGLGPMTLQSLRGPRGKRLLGKELSDAESLALRPEGGRRLAYVGFERKSRILAFPLDEAGRPGRPRPVRVPFGEKRLRHSKGLEMLAFAPAGSPLAGALVAIAERTLDQRGNNLGWFIGGPRPGRFSVRRRDDFDITDGAFLDNGDLLLLERRFRPSDGVAMRLRRIRSADLVPGRTVDGSYLLSADMRFAIDNMEGLAVGRNSRGETEITLVSDDNFSILQRNLLLRFVLIEERSPAGKSGPAEGGAGSHRADRDERSKQAHQGSVGQQSKGGEPDLDEEIADRPANPDRNGYDDAGAERVIDDRQAGIAGKG